MKYEQDDKKAHLEFLQLAINRMASNSFILKGWNITLIVGLFALTLKDLSSVYLYLAILPALAFWGLDAYYLRQERLFRELYDSVRKTKRKDIDPYSLNTQSVNGKVKNWFYTLFSPTVILLHGAVILFITIFIIIVRGGV
ncbi:hypothetical protein HYT23_05175 [Candidatus Pacearchaeota archaeon]|nr:hypothetical protein [Candidatus Pacearchaeota archaeon]